LGKLASRHLGVSPAQYPALRCDLVVVSSSCGLYAEDDRARSLRRLQRTNQPVENLEGKNWEPARAGAVELVRAPASSCAGAVYVCIIYKHHPYHSCTYIYTNCVQKCIFPPPMKKEEKKKTPPKKLQKKKKEFTQPICLNPKSEVYYATRSNPGAIHICPRVS